MRLNLKSDKRIKKTLFILVLLGLIIFLNVTGLVTDLKNFFFLISAPIQKTLWQAGKNVSDFTTGILRVSNLQNEIEILQLENQELTGQIVALFELQKENKTLREALNLNLPAEFDLLLGQTISKDISQDAILINKGRQDGVSQGQPVITEQKVLLGKIGQVYNNFSEVILISNKENSFDAKIIRDLELESEPAEIYGIAKGRGNYQLYLDFIGKEEEIFEKDIVVSSALGGIYPPGLLVGEIKTVKKSDVDPFQLVEIEPAFEVEKLDYLFIMTKW